MKFNTFMPDKLKPYFKEELMAYEKAFLVKDYLKAFHHLERAHIIGQAYPYHHSLVHWKMLLFGIKTKNMKEIIGQIPRLLVGGVKSFIGKIPVGNTGGANVPPLRPMEISEELKKILK